MIKKAKRHTKIVCNPILDWTDEDVWNYIRANNITYNPLYDEGFTRVGCVGCPLAGGKHMRREFARWPKYEKLYRRTCQKLFEEQKAKGRPPRIKAQEGYVEVKNGDEIFDWWVNLRR